MALKAEDCILNNWVFKDGKYKQLRMCGFMDLHSFPNHFEGIPLDESVLLKCGLEMNVFKGVNFIEPTPFIDLVFAKDHFVISVFDYESDTWQDLGLKRIYFLHELQNWFIANIDGKHLTFKP